MMKADDSLEHTIDEMVDLLEEATLNDGYLDTFYSIKNPKKRFSNLRDHHELYCFGHLAEAAVAYYEATGKKQLLHLAERFADLICELFGKEEGKCHGYPGHELAEMALVRLYRHTGKTSYLELARYFVLERGREPNYFRKEHGEKDSDMRYYQAQQPVQEQMEAVGHAVRAMYLYSGLTDLAVEYDDGELAKVAKRLWKNVIAQKNVISPVALGRPVMEKLFLMLMIFRRIVRMRRLVRQLVWCFGLRECFNCSQRESMRMLWNVRCTIAC